MKTFFGLIVIIAILCFIAMVGGGEAIAWGFGLVIGVWLAILAIKALSFATKATALAAVSDAVKVLSPQPITVQKQTISINKDNMPESVLASVGILENYWTCMHCSVKNEGHRSKCRSCSCSHL